VPTRFISWHGLCANRAAHEFASAAPRFSQAPPFYHLAAQIAPLRQLKRYLINTFRPYLGIPDGRRLSRRSYQQTRGPWAGPDPVFMRFFRLSIFSGFDSDTLTSRHFGLPSDGCLPGEGDQPPSDEGREDAELTTRPAGRPTGAHFARPLGSLAERLVSFVQQPSEILSGGRAI
jgi:hypothetical protein